MILRFIHSSASRPTETCYEQASSDGEDTIQSRREEDTAAQAQFTFSEEGKFNHPSNFCPQIISKVPELNSVENEICTRLARSSSPSIWPIANDKIAVFRLSVKFAQKF
jgi:hypothetical protein